MWVGGEGKRAFTVERAKEQTGWLDVGQVAAKAIILSAMKVMFEEKTVGSVGEDSYKGQIWEAQNQEGW